jgi:hypothetical protein
MQIVAPGFNEAVLDLVWKTTTEIYFEMAGSKGWSGLGSGKTVEVPDVPELMLKVGFPHPGRMVSNRDMSAYIHFGVSRWL